MIQNKKCLNVVKLPTFKVQKFNTLEKSKSPQPIKYQSPIVNLKVKPRNTSPGIRERQLSPEKYDKITQMEKNNGQLYEYSQLLSQFKNDELNNLKNILKFNKEDRQFQNTIIKQQEDQQLSSFIKLKRRQLQEKIDEQDLFFVKEHRLNYANKLADLDRIQKEQEWYKQRKVQVIQRLQNEKYSSFWKKKAYLILNSSYTTQDIRQHDYDKDEF